MEEALVVLVTVVNRIGLLVSESDEATPRMLKLLQEASADLDMIIVDVAHRLAGKGTTDAPGSAREMTAGTVEPPPE